MKKKSSKNRLTKKEIEELRDLLLQKRREILGDVSCMENETLKKNRSDLSNMPIHMADMGTDNYEMEHTLGLMDSEIKILREIDEALQRIEEGTYGICLGNEEKIPKQRLEAIPWARYCLNCADLAEKGLISSERTSISENYDYNVEEQQNDTDD